MVSGAIDGEAMNGIRCAIFLLTDGYRRPIFVGDGVPEYFMRARIFGSHSEAKRELRHWTDSYPDARIVDEVDL